MAVQTTGGEEWVKVLLLLSSELGLPLLVLHERYSRYQRTSYWVDAQEIQERQIRRLSFNDALEALTQIDAGKRTGCLIISLTSFLLCSLPFAILTTALPFLPSLCHAYPRSAIITPDPCSVPHSLTGAKFPLFFKRRDEEAPEAFDSPNDDVALQDYTIYSFVGQMSAPVAPAWLISMHENLKKIAEAARQARKRTNENKAAETSKRPCLGKSRRERALPEGEANSARETRLAKVKNSWHPFCVGKPLYIADVSY